MNINELQKLASRKKKNVIGLMSGTSLDGVDAVLVEVSGCGTKTKIKQLGFITYPFPRGLKKKILENSKPNSGNVTDICRLNFLIAHLYFDAVKELCRKSKFNLADVDLIGSHGQTVHHLPLKRNYYGYNFGSTLQIGDPSVIAKLTGVLTIGDFRTGDVALGGQGAPLVPYFDHIMFHSNKKNRALLNIGGISNITVLNRKGDASSVIAFDTGPGNMMLDLLAKKYFNVEYDKSGNIASGGKINQEILRLLKKQDNYIEKKIPKSTGREYYGAEFLAPLLKKFRKVPKEDLLATVADFTAYGVYRNYEKFIKSETEIAELFVSGGGARNNFIMNSLKKYFGRSVEIKNVKDLGISSDAKEAICFAVLANETLAGNPANIQRVTCAIKPTILGKICLP
ncbi:MAG: anhydro-N-acetylmuramic acid kinase [Ignavibacteriaceae bacterium]|nr:anhydro-N-acetylmuramic acid kinase [Ignavibacteriaceae bacterium]